VQGVRFGQRFLAFKHPAGLGFEVIDDPRDMRMGTVIEGIGTEEDSGDAGANSRGGRKRTI
jgi:hypothetical protein